MKYDEKLKVGVFRFDYADGGRSDNWNPNMDINPIETSDILTIVNKVVKMFPDLKSIQLHCGGTTINDTTLIEGYHTEMHSYCIRLYPTLGEYNCYIYIYKKQ